MWRCGYSWPLTSIPYGGGNVVALALGSSAVVVKILAAVYVGVKACRISIKSYASRAKQSYDLGIFFLYVVVQ